MIGSPRRRRVLVVQGQGQQHLAEFGGVGVATIALRSWLAESWRKGYTPHTGGSVRVKKKVWRCLRHVDILSWSDDVGLGYRTVVVELRCTEAVCFPLGSGVPPAPVPSALLFVASAAGDHGEEQGKSQVQLPVRYLSA